MELILSDLKLKTVGLNDINEVARMWNFEKGPISLAEAKKAISKMQDNHSKNKTYGLVHLCLAIYEKDGNKIIGWCGLDAKNEQNLVHIFYLIDKNYRNKGYASQCAKKLLDYGFNTLKLLRIDGACHINNIASKRVLENIGMKLQYSTEDSYYYYVTKKQWIT